MSESEKYLTIRALTAYLKRKFDADPYLEKVYVTGEISNLGRRRGRHLYFSIKDPEGQAVISAAMFSYANRLKFVPEEGMKVNAVGRIQVYEPSGTYSIILEQMTPDGIGDARVVELSTAYHLTFMYFFRKFVKIRSSVF